MSREIRTVGGQFPSQARFKLVYSTDFASYYDTSLPYNGFPWEKYPHQCFPWLAEADENNITLEEDRDFHVVMPDAGGVNRSVRVRPQLPSRQTRINNEMSCILWRHYLEEYNLEHLVQLLQEDGKTFVRLQAQDTPDEIKDEFRAVGSNFTVTGLNATNRSITVSGEKYYRKRKTTKINVDGSPVYDIGEHVGFDRYMRDQLDTDSEFELDRFKTRVYPHGFILHGQTEYAYSTVIDTPTHDQRTGPHPDDYSTGTVKYPFNAAATSSHEIFFRDFLPTTIVVGDTITLQNHLPQVTSMLGSAGDMSQRYGIWDFEWRFDMNARQFSAGFLWALVRYTFQRDYEQSDKECEIDVKELPAGTFTFMNTHRPSGGMLDYAELNGLEPVMPGGEWTEDIKQQHQIFIAPGDDGYVDSSEFHTTRVAIFPPGNPWGIPGNSVHWYERVDGVFRFYAGCLLSPDFHNGPLDALNYFLSHAVDGDFVADMEYFAPNNVSSDYSMPINLDVASVDISQFHGQEAGGSGWPDPAGYMPEGFGPSFDDKTGLSGSGIINITSDPSTQIVDDYETVGRRNDGSLLLVPTQ